MSDVLKDKIYIGFDDWQDVEDQFVAALGPEPEVIYARYEHGGYEGHAIIIFKRGDQWFCVFGAHCSCYGLEGQWEEEAFDPSRHLESAKQGRREIVIYDAGEEGQLDFDRWLEWHSRLHFAPAPVTDEEVARLREALMRIAAHDNTGLTLVPIEATPEMQAAAAPLLSEVNDIIAAHAARTGGPGLSQPVTLAQIYSAMIAASPFALPEDTGNKREGV